MSLLGWCQVMGAASGAAHAVGLYLRRAREAPRGAGPHAALRVHARAGYYAAWTLGLWVLFAPTLIPMWLVATPLYLLGRRSRGARPWLPDTPPPTGSDEPYRRPAPVRRVAIIGAGVSGLATARALLAEGIECVVFERRPCLGGVWAQGYTSFGVQVQRELYEFPDAPLPEGTPDFTPGPVIQRYLEDYAKHHGIAPHIRFEAEVRGVSRKDDGSGWAVEFTRSGATSREHFDFAVIAVGVYSASPSMPRFDGQDVFAGEILHSSEVQDRERLRGRRVLVVGYGKSATDLALEASAVAQETSIAIRTPHWPLPSRLAGILPFKWGILNRLSSALIPRYYRPSHLETALHTLGAPLVWLYWRSVETLLVAQLSLGSRHDTRVGLVPSEPLEVGGFDESIMLPRPDFHRALRDGRITPHHTTVEAFEPGHARLGDGSRIEVDTVILATGWKTDFAFLSDAVRSRLGASDDGFYLYRHVLHPDLPGLAFIGRATTVVNILTYALQARWLTDWLAGRIEIPATEAMRDEIERMTRWKRSWLPYSADRSARLVLHMQHYHDELLRDLGADPLRKKGLLAPLAELIAPYEPADYAEIVSGTWRAQRSR